MALAVKKKKKNLASDLATNAALRPVLEAQKLQAQQRAQGRAEIGNLSLEQLRERDEAREVDTDRRLVGQGGLVHRTPTGGRIRFTKEDIARPETRGALRDVLQRSLDIDKQEQELDATIADQKASDPGNLFQGVFERRPTVDPLVSSGFDPGARRISGGSDEGRLDRFKTFANRNPKIDISSKVQRSIAVYKKAGKLREAAEMEQWYKTAGAKQRFESRQARTPLGKRKERRQMFDIRQAMREGNVNFLQEVLSRKSKLNDKQRDAIKDRITRATRQKNKDVSLKLQRERLDTAAKKAAVTEGRAQAGIKRRQSLSLRTQIAQINLPDHVNEFKPDLETQKGGDSERKNIKALERGFISFSEDTPLLSHAEQDRKFFGKLTSLQKKSWRKFHALPGSLGPVSEETARQVKKDNPDITTAEQLDRKLEMLGYTL